jgi:uncharacterized protein (DUF4415 family)
MQFFKMAAFTYGVQTQDYNGGIMGDVRDLLREQEDAARAAIKEPQRPQRPKISGKMTKEERVAAEKTYTDAYKKYEADMKVVQTKRRDVQDKLRKEQRGYQEAMNDVRDTMRYTSVSTRDAKLALPHDYQYSDAKPKSVVSAGTMMGHDCVCQPGETPSLRIAFGSVSSASPSLSRSTSSWT